MDNALKQHIAICLNQGWQMRAHLLRFEWINDRFQLIEAEKNRQLSQCHAYKQFAIRLFPKDKLLETLVIHCFFFFLWTRLLCKEQI
jgi:hypothetical protein